MRIEDSVAVVTGANRGLGRHLAAELIERGARTVYAGARRPDTVDLPGVVPLPLDVTDPEQVADAAHIARDATVVINNAGFSAFARLTSGDMADIRREIETNYLGTLHMVRAFVPVMERLGGGAFLNISSVMAWMGYEHSNSYGASKAANWALSNGLRTELADTDIQVSSMLLASTDTDMMAGIDVPKNRPEDVVTVALDELERGTLEILADDISRDLKAGLSADRGQFVPHAERAA